MAVTTRECENVTAVLHPEAQDAGPRRDVELLRRYVAARRRGDSAEALDWWKALVTENFDRIAGMVALQARRAGLSAEEREQALELALYKLAAEMVTSFRGTSVGEWVNATLRCTEFACLQVRRDAAHRRERERSLDTELTDAQAYAAIRGDRAERDRAEPEWAEAGREFLEWALPQLTEGRRTVIELFRRGYDVPEIQRRLAVSADVVYARRSRAMADLVKLSEQWRP